MNNIDDILNSNTPTLIDFFATWCGPCKIMSPIIEQTKNSLGNDINILKIDIDNNMNFASKYSIRSVPTLILFKDGKIIWRKSGVINSTELIEKINKSI